MAAREILADAGLAAPVTRTARRPTYCRAHDGSAGMTAPADGPPRALDRPPRRDLLLISFAVLMLSTSGPLIRSASGGAPAMAVAMWRNVLACVVLVPYTLLTRRREIALLQRRDLLLCVGSGLVLAAHFATWVPSINFTTVASSTALVAMQPVWAAVIARLRGERVVGAGWIGIGVAVAGAAVLGGVDFGISSRAVWGDVLALVGGMLSGAYVTIGGSVRQRVSTTLYTAICYSTAGAVLFVVCLVGGQRLGGYPAGAWTAILGLTAGAQLLGHSVFNHVLKTTSATFVSLAILFEVAGAALLAGVFFREWPPVAAIPAAAVMLAGIVVVVRAGSRPEVSGVPALD
jgi:drug/metabolite transporter (DMT)-like permease